MRSTYGVANVSPQSIGSGTLAPKARMAIAPSLTATMLVLISPVPGSELKQRPSIPSGGNPTAWVSSLPRSFARVYFIDKAKRERVPCALPCFGGTTRLARLWPQRSCRKVASQCFENNLHRPARGPEPWELWPQLAERWERHSGLQIRGVGQRSGSGLSHAQGLRDAGTFPRRAE